ncbi:MAG: hypothetical protein ACJ8CR_23245 [Roseiflexaceae bacterium]
MTPEQIKQVIQGGQWVSITTELRPSSNKSATGEIQPFYCSRVFTYSPGDRFACTVMNYADPNGKVPLVKIVIKGHNAWGEAHPIAPGAYNLDYIADEAYEVTPLHQGFADIANRFPANGLNTWQVNVMQDLLGKAFPLFSLVEGQTYVDYDLIYIYNDMLFNGSKNVDGRAFDKPENRPTNLQIPLARQQ